MSQVIYTNDEGFEKAVLNSQLPVLVDFYADGCPPCNAISSSLDELSDEYAGKLRVVKVNVFQSGHTAANYNIRAVPQLMAFKNGKMLLRSEGARPKSEIEKLIKHALAA
ncbi:MULTISPECIES: thioredoxin family protein [Pseudomonadota]|uniref:thioredoxin family protein n=1 Tax=Pseudomonadota TaxID=1224 RepID=UPI0013EB9510|nr:thioredoxin domain-containing protein [Neisseria yangbaofengii]